MSKHTPGPWIAEDRPGVGWIVRWGNLESQVCSLRWVGGPHLPEVDRIVEADARLIAAAPDLLDVCKKTIARPEEVQRIMRANNLKIDNMDDPYQGLAFTLYTMLVESANEAEAAIAKVEESP
ncbi:MAG: hypothetical protein KJI72_04130 [Patescibacteria group bacterium]|nr:hypothetical protein [Patescibacteria group bacterium]